MSFGNERENGGSSRLWRGNVFLIRERKRGGRGKCIGSRKSWRILLSFILMRLFYVISFFIIFRNMFFLWKK